MSYEPFIPNAHSLSIREAAQALNTDPDAGLKVEEAARRLSECGRNTIPKDAPHGVFRILADQFIDPVIGILVAAAVLAFVFKEAWEGLAILAVIMLSITIGFAMEYQARRTLEALRKIGQYRTRPIRSGSERVLRFTEVVPGDLIVFGPGDIIPADLRLVAGEQLTLKEAALTGESTPVAKQNTVLEEGVPIHSRENMLYKGTTVLTGSGRGLVVATGIHSQLGRLQQMGIDARTRQTPLERKLRAMSLRLIWLTLVLAAGIGILGYARGGNLAEMIETGLALAIAAIPEGLPVVATIALARGMLRLSRRDVIVKNLDAVQTLGATDLIFTDKTGTLTEDNLQVYGLLLGKIPTTHIVTDQGFRDEPPAGLDDVFETLMRAAVLCNNVREEMPVSGGDALEKALVDFAVQIRYPISCVRKNFPEYLELPFDPKRKLMGTVHRHSGKYHIYVKGAFEQVAPHCGRIWTASGYEPFKDQDDWEVKVAEMAATGLRTLAFAYTVRDVKPTLENLLRELCFLGVIGFLDPPRKDVRPIFEVYRKAGIRVVMVTGDHPDTAQKIGEEVGLLERGSVKGKVVSGTGVPDSRSHEGIKVFARVLPEEKLNLVRHYQEKGHVVGMIGDGINDVPALSKADIGIAMGIRGTEAAREAADIILKNDSFAAIELAIRQGRVIFSNIKNFVIYLLSCNLAEILVVAASALAKLPAPLLPMQILFLNLVTDVFPALALGMGSGEEHIMNRAPRNPSKPLIEKRDWTTVGLYGLVIGMAVLGTVLFGQYVLELPPEQINNLAFYTLVFAQLIHVFNLPRAGISFWRNEVTGNPYIWGAIILSLGITWAAGTIDALAFVLGLQELNPNLLVVPVVFGLLPLLIIQFIKRGILYFRRYLKPGRPM